MTAPDQIPSLQSIAERYDAILCDVWGVLHNGARAHETAHRALAAFKGSGREVLLLSNAPRQGATVETHLTGLGVPRASYDRILTSGDATRAALAMRAEGHPGFPVFHLGPDRDLDLFAGLAVDRVDLEAARLIVCSGLFDDTTETPDDYASFLRKARARGLPMICANPDLKVERGSQLIYCAGAIAEAYEALGGEVTYFGKPHLPVYEMALGRLKRPRERILAIGDGLRTDIKGANKAGIDVLLITAGLHVDEFGGTVYAPDRASVAAVLAAADLTAIGFMPHLA
ncbi:MAG: TIGR01459 family HAD-type hydrolase [Alphaproteobacteria bacterium]|nr:TIGR01459 family HAD-type hydrolase [Alphaproteobacteria bacterium]